MSYLLPALVLLPLLVGVALAVWGRRIRTAAVPVALLTAGLQLVLATVAAWTVASTGKGISVADRIAPRLSFSPAWFDFDFPFFIRGHAVHFQLALGLDGIGALMVLLTAIVVCAVLLAASRQIADRLEAYCGLVLVTGGLLTGVFVAMDLLTFYVCFEAVLLPVVLLIGLWGERATASRAATRFLLFTLAGSIPMVVGLIGLMTYSADRNTPPVATLDELTDRIAVIDASFAAPPVEAPSDLVSPVKHRDALGWILGTLLFALGIKMAIVPLHAWLPATYASAHPNTTALVAAVVGKLGLYGIIRLVLPMMPQTLDTTARFLFAALGAAAIVYGALAALAQRDPRRMFAYSSISHLGFITIGLMSYERIGVEGAVLQMFNHGVIIAAIFLLIAAAELRYGRREIDEQYHGLATTSPGLGALFVFFLLASAGLPGLNSFVGELMTLSGLIDYSLGLTAISVLGLLLGAWYCLRFIQQILFGEPTRLRADAVTRAGQTSRVEGVAGLSSAEKSAVFPLAVLCLVIGVMPMTATRLFSRDAGALTELMPPRPDVASNGSPSR